MASEVHSTRNPCTYAADDLVLSILALLRILGISIPSLSVTRGFDEGVVTQPDSLRHRQRGYVLHPDRMHDAAQKRLSTNPDTSTSGVPNADIRDLHNRDRAGHSSHERALTR